MRRILHVAAALLMVTGSAATSSADFLQSLHRACDGCDDQACDASECDACGCDLLAGRNSSRISLSGWINAGFIGNVDDPTSRFNGPYNAVDRSNEAMLNQFYLIAERSLPTCGNGIGGRVDFLYGEDYFLAESIGIEKRQDGSSHWNREYYGVAFPQAFVSLGNQDLNLQVGHFYSVVGYEGVMAPDNFFYSKSYSYQFAGPFTHWGGQINWSPSESLTTTVGLHNGWDAFDRVSDSVGFIGKVRYDSASTGAWTSFALTTGEEFNDSANVAPTQDFSNRTRYSFLVGLPLTCRLDYVFHHWLGLQERGAADGGQADWFGIDQYLTYEINNCWKTALRFEWFRDDEGTRVGLNRGSNPNVPPFAGNFFSLSWGVNWNPMDNLIFRPELRSDWFDGTGLPFDDGGKDSQFMLGFDAIMLF